MSSRRKDVCMFLAGWAILIGIGILILIPIGIFINILFKWVVVL